MNVKNKILESALNVFIEKGFYKARIEDIAKKAGIAKGTVYLYFKNKKELFFSSIINEFEKFYSKMKKILKKEKEPEKKLKKILYLFYENLKKKRKYFESAIRLWPGEIGEEIIKLILPRIRKILTEIESILKEGKKKGIFKNLQSPYSDAVIIMGMIRASAMADIFFGKEVPFEKTWIYIENLLKIKEV